MMTLIAQLCALCAMSALMQMAVPDGRYRGGLKLICGLLMLKLTLSGAQRLLGALASEGDLTRIFETLLQ